MNLEVFFVSAMDSGTTLFNRLGLVPKRSEQCRGNRARIKFDTWVSKHLQI